MAYQCEEAGVTTMRIAPAVFASAGLAACLGPRHKYCQDLLVQFVSPNVIPNAFWLMRTELDLLVCRCGIPKYCQFAGKTSQGVAGGTLGVMDQLKVNQQRKR